MFFLSFSLFFLSSLFDILLLVIQMIPLSNVKLYKEVNKENQTIEKFRKANPQFKIDLTNVASTIKEVEYFEHLYSHMSIGCFEFSP